MFSSMQNSTRCWSDGVCPLCRGVMELDEIDNREILDHDLDFGLRCTGCGAICEPWHKNLLLSSSM